MIEAFTVGARLARDGGLIADEYFPDAAGSNCGSWLAGDGGLIGGVILAGVYIHSCGHGFYGFRPYGESLLKSAKVTQTLLPHHLAPRPGSVCPHSGIAPRAAATGHPWPGAAKPASCRFTRCAIPAFGLGLIGAVRSRSKAKAQRPPGRLEC